MPDACVNILFDQMDTDIALRDFSAKQEAMSRLVRWFIDAQRVVSNPLTQKILAQLDNILTVADRAAVACFSPGQLQRTLKQATGFSPHDLRKDLRIQQSFKQHSLGLYADQSHCLDSFRRVTGYTPAKYIAKFDV